MGCDHVRMARTLPLPLVLLALRLMNRRRRYTSADALRAAVAADRQHTRVDPPAALTRRCQVTERRIGGHRCLTLTPPAVRHPAQLTYVHGGGHVAQISPYHWRLLGQLAESVGCTVHVPLYPLSPEHAHPAAFAMLDALYAEQVAQHGAEHCVWMGDSSGGGLALVIAQRAVARGLPAVRDLILISPWLDLALSDPELAQLAARDPWLDLPGMAAAAAWWAGGDDPSAPHLSPVNGPLAGLQRLNVFMGTRDLLWPASRRLLARAQTEGVAMTLHEARDMIHVWPLLPIAQARPAIQTMSALIRTPASVAV